MELDFDVIRKHLKHGNEREDKEMFQKWSLGYIETERVIKYFCHSNKVPTEEKRFIQPENFVSWLNSLGYRRKDGLQNVDLRSENVSGE